MMSTAIRTCPDEERSPMVYTRRFGRGQCWPRSVGSSPTDPEELVPCAVAHHWDVVGTLLSPLDRIREVG